ncbi:hypothetical protein NJBCHELONAE_15520 [Mycobacteroides chelonae]|nr:hypothetical protein NJBCHELONAE_15520 [Mycobacteroides chelonae]
MVAVTVSVTVSVDEGGADGDRDDDTGADVEGVVTDVMGTSGGTVVFSGTRSRNPRAMIASTPAAAAIATIHT